MGKNRKEGFTLIEMLVVVAMIGILSTVVLIALGPSRNKARDTRIISDVNQIRSYLETTYDSVGGTYQAVSLVSATNDTSDGATIDKLVGDIGANGGAVTINNDSSKELYAVSATTNGSGTYCVDSSGTTASSTASGGQCGGALPACSTYSRDTCPTPRCWWSNAGVCLQA